MPTDLVRVFHVTSTETRQPGLRVFVITTTLVARPDICLQLETVNPYAATLCLRAKDLNRSIAVRWQKTRYGSTLREAFFLKAPEAA
jgi:hypothetical protein